MTTDPPARFRHRIPEIEAVQWTGSNADQLRAFCGPDFDEIDLDDRIEDPDQTAAVREADHGTWRGLAPGDWVVRLDEGLYEFSAADFAKQYEPAAAPSAPADRAGRSERYAAAIRDTAGWVLDDGQHMIAAVMAVADAEQVELRRERDLAIAHDRQPYPTAWAYEQACAALRTHRSRADALEQEVRRLGLMVDEYGAGASALTDKLKRARDMHRETCIAAKGDVSPTAFTCGMCEVLDAPAAAVLPPDGRAASYRLAADAIESMQGYPHLILPEEIVEGLRLLAAGMQPEPGSPAYTRRLAAGERDEQQAQQGGAETRDALMAAHAALAAHAGRQQAVLTRIGQMADHWEQQLPEVIRTPAVVSAIRAALERADTPAAAPAAGQPPADTGEEAREETVHARPGPDDNGISPCCGRPPFEFRGERLTRDPALVTCPTSPAVVAEPGKESDAL